MTSMRYVYIYIFMYTCTEKYLVYYLIKWMLTVIRRYIINVNNETIAISPHHCVGFLFLDMYLPPPLPRPPRPLPPSLCHTPSFTHVFVTHTTLSHTIFHIQLCHTPSFTQIFVTHLLSHTIFHTPSLSHTTLSHTTSFTYNFVTHHF